jgi:hypothetical protein
MVFIGMSAGGDMSLRANNVFSPICSGYRN